MQNMTDYLENTNSIDSIVVLSGADNNNSYLTSHTSSNTINCIPDDATIHNNTSSPHHHHILNDTDSSSFITTNAEKECSILEKELQNLRLEIKAYKQENSHLKKHCEFLTQKLDNESAKSIENEKNIKKATKIRSLTSNQWF